MEAINPLFPIAVDGWRGAIRSEELESLEVESIDRLIESAYSDPALARPWHPHADQFQDHS